MLPQNGTETMVEPGTDLLPAGVLPHRLHARHPPLQPNVSGNSIFSKQQQLRKLLKRFNTLSFII